MVKNPPTKAGETVQSLIQEDPTCCGATKPTHYNYLACALELGAVTAEAPEAVLCNEKPPQGEAREPQLESRPHLLQLERGPHSSKDPAQPKMDKKLYFLKKAQAKEEKQQSIRGDLGTFQSL